MWFSWSPETSHTFIVWSLFPKGGDNDSSGAVRMSEFNEQLLFDLGVWHSTRLRIWVFVFANCCFCRLFFSHFFFFPFTYLLTVQTLQKHFWESPNEDWSSLKLVLLQSVEVNEYSGKYKEIEIYLEVSSYTWKNWRNILVIATIKSMSHSILSRSINDYFFQM